MQVHAHTMAARKTRAAYSLIIAAAFASIADAQAPADLTLTAAHAEARAASVELAAARAAVEAERARERQAAARSNPSLSYDTERTSGGGAANAQHVVGLEQRIELGVIGARRVAAGMRREAAEARLAAAEAALHADVVRAYGAVLAARARAASADRAHAIFSRATRTSEARLAAGDVSGFAHRRLTLEAARYAAVRAEALVAARAAEAALATLLGRSPLAEVRLAPADGLEPRALIATNADSLVRLSARRRYDVTAAQRDADAAAAEVMVARRERAPSPTLTVGWKSETAAGAPERLGGYVAGVSVPLPLFDRRTGQIAALEAERRRLGAVAVGAQRRVALEVVVAHARLAAAEEQRATLARELAQASVAVQAADVAYAEGEINLTEWLDAMRAYQEAEASLATLQAEVLIRTAELQLVAGVVR